MPSCLLFPSCLLSREGWRWRGVGVRRRGVSDADMLGRVRTWLLWLPCLCFRLQANRGDASATCRTAADVVLGPPLFLSSPLLGAFIPRFSSFSVSFLVSSFIHRYSATSLCTRGACPLSTTPRSFIDTRTHRHTRANMQRAVRLHAYSDSSSLFVFFIFVCAACWGLWKAMERHCQLSPSLSLPLSVLFFVCFRHERGVLLSATAYTTFYHRCRCTCRISLSLSLFCVRQKCLCIGGRCSSVGTHACASVYATCSKVKVQVGCQWTLSHLSHLLSFVFLR